MKLRDPFTSALDGIDREASRRQDAEQGAGTVSYRLSHRGYTGLRRRMDCRH